MILSFADLESHLSLEKPVQICVAGAADKDLLLALKTGQEKGYLEAILVGNASEITPIAEEVGLKNYRVVEPADGNNAAEEAVSLIRKGEADTLMKGTVDTTVYMRAALNRDKGLRTDSLACVITGIEIPGYHKLLFATDSGLNIAPNLEQKTSILRDALGMLHGLGYENPKVAFLAASEVVNPKIPATVDAFELTQAAARGEFGACIAEGPLALDVIFDPQAAQHKNITSAITGDVDLLLYPNMETGNALCKSWIHFSQAKWGGLVLGCVCPIILGSRSDTAEVKINSIILGCISAQSRHSNLGSFASI